MRLLSDVGHKAHRRIVQAESLPLNDVKELKGHIEAVVQHVERAVAERADS